MKKIISLMLSLILVSAMAMPAFAAPGTPEWINKSEYLTFSHLEDIEITLTEDTTYDLSASIFKQRSEVRSVWTVVELDEDGEVVEATTLSSETKQVGDYYVSTSSFVVNKAGVYVVTYRIEMFNDKGNSDSYYATKSFTITAVDPEPEIADIDLECAYVVDITEKDVVMVPVIQKGNGKKQDEIVGYEVTLFVDVEYSDGNFEEMSFYKRININKGKNEHITATVDHTCDEEDCSVGSFSKKFEIVLPS